MCTVSPNAGLTVRNDLRLPAEDPDYMLQGNLSWLRLESDATTIDTSSDTDDSNEGAGAPHGVRVDDDPDRLPRAWCHEAERETPEPEKHLNVRAHLSTQAHGATLGAGLSNYAPSAAHESVQQDPFHMFASLSDIACGLEVGRDILTGEMIYRKRVLELQGVNQRTFCQMIDRKCVHAVFYLGKPATDELVHLLYDGSVVLRVEGLEVVAPAAEWSDWNSWESYKADEASYTYYQTVLKTGGSFC
ncbi:hypothetical protein B0J12DRAFT_705697 [Macrophomina phaseolina]|uniref:Uncharacterized protein n=1 Tax=Macrophomina phaseolina TaxID=35725 RepID=A0ABQ8FRD6_9PEZI|nr:hypothetical protein B0J12DRAFT_705697 [Macrophomina phaseolina]